MKKEAGTHDTRSKSNDAAPIGEETHEVGLTGTYTDLLSKQSEFFRCNPNVLGGGDILFITVGEPVARAGLLASLLAGIATDDGKRVIQKYLMVLPTETDLSAANTLAWNYFKSGFKRLAGRKMEAKESAWFRARFEVRISPDARVTSVLELIQQQPANVAVIVVEAATYRDDQVAPHLPEGAEAPLAPEDVWAPQLHALATAAVSIAKSNNIYVALDVNEITPIRQDLEALLLSVDLCGVMGSTEEDGPETIVAKRTAVWEDWINKGFVGRALRDIDELPTILDSQKPFLRIQILHKAELNVEALAALRAEFVKRDNIDHPTRARLARVAMDAGASSLARELLEASVEALNSREDLESALGTLISANAHALAHRIAERLEERFPGSEKARRYHRNQRLQARDYTAVADLWREEDPTVAAFYEALSIAFTGNTVPDYLGLIQSAEDDAQSDAYRMASIDDALARGLTVPAFELAVLPPATPSFFLRWEKLLLNVLERAFLDAGEDGSSPVEPMRVQEAFRALLVRLVENPLNVTLRVGLVELLRPNIAGTFGLVMIAKIILDVASEPIKSNSGFTFNDADMEWLVENKPFLKCALEWLKDEQPIVIGKLKLPSELLTVNPDTAISALASYLDKAPVSDENDVQALRLYLTIAAAIAPYSSDPDIDLRLYRHAAGKIVSAGFPQHGRDLVEAAMQAGVATSRRRRLAWFATADVYHRSHDHLTGLVALGCTFLADDAADKEQLWQEIYTTARYMRDIGLFDIALTVVKKGREHLAHMGFHDTHGHRLDLLDIQVRVNQIGPDDHSGLESLLVDAVRVGQAVLQHQDETAPTGIMLGQLIRTARSAGVEISDEAKSVFAELSKWSGGNLQALIEATSMDIPSVDQLARLVDLIPEARFAEDVGYDMNVVSNIAKRALTDDKILTVVESVSFTLEVTSDWGTALPHRDERAAPPPVPKKSEPALIARALSEEGVTILQLGLDSNGLLVRVESTKNVKTIARRETRELFSQQVFNDWSREFPRRYGFSDSANLFYTTTEHLRLSAVPDTPTIVLASTELQSFPPNILFDGEEFLGRKQPVASAPSLAWLKGAFDRNWLGDGRLVAWISTAENEGKPSTLSLLAQRLEAPLAEYEFSIDTSPTIPVSFVGATLAVLTAHGGVNSEGKYFQAVADEGVLLVSADDLARSVQNVGVVVLFVCSGGRVDKHPGANTTIGFAKKILDRGCSAVIASPWPLNSQVPPHWLPEFLRVWTGGATLMEAVFAANKVVDARFALDPACGLAMNVYGNPLLKRP